MSETKPTEALLLPAEAAGPQLPADFAAACNVSDVVKAYLERQSPNTRAAYAKDLMVFARFLAEKGAITLGPGQAFSGQTAVAAAEFLLTQTPGRANNIGLHYRNWLLTKKAEDGTPLAGSTVDRRLSALKSLVRIGRLLGLVSWSLEIQCVGKRGSAKTRDVRGPGRDGVKLLYGALSKRYEKALALKSRHPHRAREAQLKALAVLRDRAILSLLYLMALRRFEVAPIRLIDVNAAAKKLRVRRKGDSGEYTLLTIPDRALEPLQRWIKEGRGGCPADAPVFVSLNNLRIGTTAVTDRTIYNAIVSLGKEAGLRTWPHGLRHAGITEALDRTNGDVRSVAKFSGHRSIQTVMTYDDDRRDMQGQIANQIGEGL